MTTLSPDDRAPSTELAPPRMLDGGAGEPERRLLASAQLDRVPSAAKARVAQALGAVLDQPVGPSAEPREPPEPERTPRPDALGRLGARAAVGVAGAGILGAIALSFWLRATPRESSNAGATPALPASSEIHSDGVPSRPAEHAAPPAPAEPPQRAETTETADRSALHDASSHHGSSSQRPKRQAAPSPVGPVDSGLLAEVRALEAVSTALGAGQADRAERALAAYRRRFARGELAIEADVLGIQLAVARGDRAAASAGAERLLARPEAEHYRARVRSLLDREAQPSGAPARENLEPRRSNDAPAHMRARR